VKVSAASSGRLLFVAPRGNDAAPGTKRRPWRTIRRAVRALRPGDRVYVRAGVYPERIFLKRGGTALAPVSLRAYPGERVVLTGELLVKASYVRVSQFVFEGQTDANRTDVLVSVDGNYVTLIHNEIRRAAMSGIIVGRSDGVRIIGNWIHDNGTHIVNRVPQDHGIYWSDGRRGIVANNIVDHNIGYGIHLYPNAIDTLVTGNTVAYNGYPTEGSQGASGIIVGGESSAGNVIVNNIVAWNSEYGIRSLDPVPGNRVLRNLGYGNSRGDFPSGDAAQGLSYADNLVAAPDFVDAGKGNFNLARHSPALGRALPAYTLRRDFAGRLRSSRRPDLGALERR
jgi:parallel beta-helix repeat protein